MAKISLKNKIIFSITTTVIILGGVATVLVFVRAKNVLIGIAKNDLMSNVVEQTHETAQIFVNSQNMVETLAGLPEIADYLQKKEPQFQDKRISGILTHYNIGQNFSAICLLNATGTALVSTDESFVRQDYSFRDYFAKAMSGEPSVGMNVGITDHEPGYYFSHPVKSADGRIWGAAVVKLIPDVVHNSLIRGPIGTAEQREQEIVMFADSDGIILYSDDPERIYKSLGPLDKATQEKLEVQQRFPGIQIRPLQYEIVRQEIVDFTGPQTFEFFDQAERRQEIIGIARINQWPFFLVVETGTTNLFAAAYEIATLLALFVSLAAALAALVIFFLTSRFLRPLIQLKGVAARISAGQFEQRVNIATGDELEDLGDSFNEMAARLEEYYATLEEQVEAKTAELSRNLVFINEQNKTLEDTKKAMLNLLEDLNDEKNKIQEAKAKDDAVLTSIGDGVIVVDHSGKIVLVNKIAQDLLGWSTKELIGRIFWDIVKSENEQQRIIPADERASKLALSVGRKYRNSVFAPQYYHRKNRTKFPVVITVAPVVLNKKIIGAVNVFRDVTKEKEIDRIKSEFVSLASHQLRTPPAIIAWHVELLLGQKFGKLNKKQKKYLEEIYRADHRMVDLINALLNVSRIELGTLAVKPEKVSLKKIAESVIWDNSLQIKNKKLKMRINIAKDVPSLDIDPRLAQIIFQNLISNSIKYTPEKGRVTVEIKKRPPDVITQFSDTGLGIPQAQQTRVFTKFFRGDNIREVDPDGTGLGLYIVKSIVEQFGGKIWFESKENKGTTFYVAIPLEGTKRKEGTKTLVMKQ